jgi:hypothetical protein
MPLRKLGYRRVSVETKRTNSLFTQPHQVHLIARSYHLGGQIE